MELGTVWRNTVRQARSSPCSYTLGCLTCFVAISVAALLRSLLGSAPAVFLSQSEQENGRIDVRLFSKFDAPINYTAVREVLPSTDSDASKLPEKFRRATYSSPRQILQSTISSEYASGSVNVVASDTALDLRAGIGQNIEDIGEIPRGQIVLLQRTARALKVSEGDSILITTSARAMLTALERPGENMWDTYTVPNSTICRNGGVKCSQAQNAFLCGGVTDSSKCGGPLEVTLSMTVFKIVSGWGSRLPSTSEGSEESSVDYILVELKEWGRTIITGLDEDMQTEVLRALGIPSGQLATPAQFAIASRFGYDFVTEVLFNLPPDERPRILLSNRYEDVQQALAKFSSMIVLALGVDGSLDLQLPNLLYLNRQRFSTLYFDLVLQILFMILLALSGILVYSLLLISIESRTFEIAILRMIGTTRSGIVKLLVAQALSYSGPSLILGLTAAHIASAYIMGLFAEYSGVVVPYAGLTPSGAIYGILLGIGIPIVSSIVPIRAALNKQLSEALDVSRPKTSALDFSIIHDSGDGISPTLLGVGFTLSAFGISIYYLLPLSLLTLDLRLFFNIFFTVLLGLLFGLVLLSVNMERLVENAVMKVFFFWSPSLLRKLADSNLVSHRIRNRKTSIMYGMSLSVIIFITVALQMELSGLLFRRLQRNGAKLVIYGVDKDPSICLQEGFISQPKRRRLMELISRYQEAGLVRRSAWASVSVSNLEPAMTSLSVSNFGRTFFRSDVSLRAISPGYFAAAEPGYLVVESEWMGLGDNLKSDLSLSEQLYTARGTQGIILPSSFKGGLQISGDVDDFPVVVESVTEADATQSSASSFANVAVVDGVAPASSPVLPTVVETRLRPVAFLNVGPGLRFSQQTVSTRDAVVSAPTFLSLSAGRLVSYDEIPVRRVLVDLDESATNSDIDEFIDEFYEVSRSLKSPLGRIWDIRESASATSTTTDLIGILFSSLTAVAMTLCFFALFASMVTNIAEQTKEIAIVRALGLRTYQVVLVFGIEAFTLVLASSLSGLVVIHSERPAS
eukprot:g1231.t1